MIDPEKHKIPSSCSAREAFNFLNDLSNINYLAQTLFVVDENECAIGTITDGDIRRGIVDGHELNESIVEFMNPEFKYLKGSDHDPEKIALLKEKNITLIPILNEGKQIINILDLTKLKTFLPIDAMIMAGGEGKRLRPLTEDTPKPLLKIGDKPIMQYNLDRLRSFGVSNIFISVNYLKEKIKKTFGNGSEYSLNIKYIDEDKPLGTMGSISLVDDFRHDNILMMNSDLLTSIDFEDFYLFFKEHDAAMAVASIPYTVNVPYAVFESEGHEIKDLKEKPVYTYYSNAGIYLFKKEILKYLEKGTYMDAPDMMKLLIEKGHKVLSYHLLEYWLDIGKMEDFKKAQEDIKHLKFEH